MAENLRRALSGEAFTSAVEVAGTAFECSYHPLRDAAGAVVGASGVAAVGMTSNHSSTGFGISHRSR